MTLPQVIYTLSALSWTPIAQNKGIMPFPTEEENVGDEDIYSGLSDQIDDTVDEDEDLYDCVENEEAEGDEIYEDLMRTEPGPMPPKMTEYDKRCCCLREIQQTEEKYTDTLGSVQQVRGPEGVPETQAARQGVGGGRQGLLFVPSFVFLRL